MQIVKKYISGVLFIVLTCCSSVSALDVEYIGSITEGLSAPTSIFVGDDNLVVLEPFQDRITVFTPDGQLSGKIDVAGDAIGLARLADTRYVFCDRQARTVVLVNIQTGSVELFLDEVDLLLDPIDIVVDNAECYILDAARHEILVADPAGQIVRRIPLTMPDDSILGYPGSFALDKTGGGFYVFDLLTSRVIVFDRRGVYRKTFCSFGVGPGTITRGSEIICDPSGYVYIADRYQGRIAIFNSAGDFITDFNPSANDGRRLVLPTGMAVDDQGLLYVVSTEGPRIDMYHIDKTTYPGEAVTAGLAYPQDFDTVAIDGLQLIVHLSGPGEAREQAVVDFQLIERSDTSLLLAQGLAVLPTVDGTEPGNEDLTTVIWTPDIPLTPGDLYGWRVRVNTDEYRGDWSLWRWFTAAAVPTVYRLEQNYPNPFNPRTTLSFLLGREGPATITVHNLLGREVWRQTLSCPSPGRYRVVWEGTDQAGNSVASGVYFYRLQAGDYVQTKKMVLMK